MSKHCFKLSKTDLYFRFYPGLANPYSNMPRIQDRQEHMAEISSPFEEESPGNKREEGGAIRKPWERKKRAITRVVGDFDHPLLPMPPVRV